MGFKATAFFAVIAFAVAFFTAETARAQDALETTLTERPLDIQTGDQKESAASSRIFGVWRTAGKEGLVRIATCKDGSICGWLVRRGEMILSEFREGDDGWIEGRIHDPRSGKTYRSRLTPVDDSNLRVVGCLAVFCKSQIWTRAEAIG
ncbi:MAG: DUF2147 domain-containing protein [Maricaulaceae bacterium]